MFVAVCRFGCIYILMDSNCGVLIVFFNDTATTDSYTYGHALSLRDALPISFANNIFDKDYFESYIEKTTLQLAGLPASDLGITGDRQRYGEIGRAHV